MKSQDKFTVLIVTPNEAKRQYLEAVLRQHVLQPTVYFASDGIEGLAKLNNVPPSIVFTDLELPKLSGTQLIDSVLRKDSLGALAIVVTGNPPEAEIYLDEVVTGKLQFCGDLANEGEVNRCIVRALNFASKGSNTPYSLRFLVPGDLLLREGDPADFVYLVKKGELRAFRIVDGQEVNFGAIGKGEFVGEMAYINGEPRSASVSAVTECELVEIPVGTLDKILYQRPAWSKALLMTLTKRLKKANIQLQAKATQGSAQD